MMRPKSVVRALLAVAAMVAAESCTVHQSEAPDLTGPSNFQVPPNPASPTARFIFAPDKPMAFLPVVFDGSPSCPEAAFTGGCVLTDRSIASFQWDFGDGTTGTGQTVSHLFRSPASFNVRLTVVSDRGLSGGTTRAVAVDPGVPPKADFVFSPTSPAIGQNVSFNGAASTASAGHTIASYSWDFGDGGRGSGLTASHAYGSAGAFNVVLTVTDEAGQTAVASKSVPVATPAEVPPPTADFVFSPTAPAAGQTVFFNGSQSKAATGHSIVSYSWNFGDSGTGSGVTASHTFNTAGSYSVVLVVTDDLGQTGTVSKTVPVGSGAPTARLSLTKAGGLNILADGSASTATGTSVIATYSFNWGDPSGSTTGSSSTQPHSYPGAGTYTVVLTVTDNAGRSATTSQTITVP
jgi:PKD repeat protein